MSDRRTILASTIAAAFSAAILTTAAAPAFAADKKVEKCYGVAKAGKNDCQTATSSCAGTSKTDMQGDAFIVVPSGTCAKIAGGATEPK